MKKHLKKSLAIFAVIFLIIGGYLIYIFQFKEYDVADSEVTEITRETFKIELPDGSSIVLDEEGNIVESDDTNTIPAGSTNNGTSSGSGITNDDSTTGTNTGTAGNNGTSTKNSGKTSTNEGSTGSGSSGSTGSTDSNSSGGSANGSNKGDSSSEGASTGNNSDGGVTVASIKQKYEPVMSSLQSQANSRIDALVGRAYSEYQGKKANGESVNYAYFYNKYTSAASELESRTDKVFYSVISVIEKELVANGYGKTHAQSLINEYEAEKEARRNALLDKAMNR
ncbi:hypothetical protein M9R32_05565 [Paenisporosarcina quisquiliarum]|uniref:Uncharacterized protein n=1 Tax=Paenisporosarcina quisquiliarum TaxID=365346 RepID=A0A9X3LFU5_9BACL|nr:hypothetical protein [Paenisporosarcina quisquiliarum]MCZ8536650.1 hypothetical protein [Paenisporosarcina quisquiliarum]